jgi:hypothetical protein
MRKICHHSAAMAELSYHNHSFDAQLQIAKFTWFMIFLDDQAQNMPHVLEGFQALALSPTENSTTNPTLYHFKQHLSDMYRHWDALPSNSIVAAAFEFVTGCVLETRPEIKSMTLHASAPAWPYYLRAKTGVAQSYAFMIFEKVTNPSLGDYYQVIPDISVFIDLTNDVLSFYKEMLAKETDNYVSTLARVKLQDPIDTLRDISRDALAAHDRVDRTLQMSGSTEALEAWRTFVQGYVGFHVTQDRYKLKELLAEC